MFTLAKTIATKRTQSPGLFYLKLFIFKFHVMAKNTPKKPINTTESITSNAPLEDTVRTGTTKPPKPKFK